MNLKKLLLYSMVANLSAVSCISVISCSSNVKTNISYAPLELSPETIKLPNPEKGLDQEVKSQVQPNISQEVISQLREFTGKSIQQKDFEVDLILPQDQDYAGSGKNVEAIITATPNDLLITGELISNLTIIGVQGACDLSSLKDKVILEDQTLGVDDPTNVSEDEINKYISDYASAILIKEIQNEYKITVALKEDFSIITNASQGSYVNPQNITVDFIASKEVYEPKLVGSLSLMIVISAYERENIETLDTYTDNYLVSPFDFSKVTKKEVEDTIFNKICTRFEYDVKNKWNLEVKRFEDYNISSDAAEFFDYHNPTKINVTITASDDTKKIRGTYNTVAIVSSVTSQIQQVMREIDYNPSYTIVEKKAHFLVLYIVTSIVNLF